MWQMLGMKQAPEGVPPALAISIATYGYTEQEARQIMIEGGDRHQADEWILSLKNAGFFASTSEASASATTASVVDRDETDAGTVLWKHLLECLRTDENGFKHQMAVLDNCVKNSGGCWTDSDLRSLSSKKAGEFIPFIAITDNCPWNGCKFASSAVMHMISPPTSAAKCDACRSANRSIGGCKLPPNLSAIRWPCRLSEAYNEATAKLPNISTALFVNVMDVEVMKNPTKLGWSMSSRPGTFAHVFVMTISNAGIYLYQAYGPRGYTLYQYMDSHSGDRGEESFPISIEKGKSWVDCFELFAANLSGVFNKQANDSYRSCFGVDLLKLGCMKIGSQTDVYVQVDETTFDTQTVLTNFGLLPKPDSPSYPVCLDGTVAKSKHPPRGYEPDGGVPHYYVPFVQRCGHCGKIAPAGKSLRHCARCKKIFYCSRQCQVTDWKARHKKVCKHLGPLMLQQWQN